ncbi:hypothetical protein [Pantanalinema sp. GBBB05]
MTSYTDCPSSERSEQRGLSQAAPGEWDDPSGTRNYLLVRDRT